MSQSRNDISSVLKDKLQQHSTAVSFEAVWDKHEKSRGSHFGKSRAVTIPMIALITLLTVFTVGFASYGILRIVDNTDYSFVDDQRVIGKWQSVDIVDKIERFDPNESTFKGELYLTELAFVKGGEMLNALEGGNLTYTDDTWTKGMILSKTEKTASKYEIKVIEGQAYMFLEWKSGDYISKGLVSKYYVMKKVDSDDYAGIEVTRKEDNVDYPFINDPQMLGSWQSVDYVENIDDFRPGVKSILEDLYLTEIVISENGKVDATSTSGSHWNGAWTWTKGLILDNRSKLASKCEIKEIDGETYMFFGWKNGDYALRGMEPWYYVLKKVE